MKTYKEFFSFLQTNPEPNILDWLGEKRFEREE